MNEYTRIEVLENTLAKYQKLFIQLQPVLSMLVRKYADDGRISIEDYNTISDMLIDLYFDRPITENTNYDE